MSPRDGMGLNVHNQTHAHNTGTRKYLKILNPCPRPTAPLSVTRAPRQNHPLTSTPALSASSTGNVSKNLCGSDSGSSATHTPRTREHASPSLWMAHRSTMEGTGDDDSSSPSSARALPPPFLPPLPLLLGTVPATIHRRISEKKSNTHPKRPTKVYEACIRGCGSFRTHASGNMRGGERKTTAVDDLFYRTLDMRAQSIEAFDMYVAAVEPACYASSPPVL